MVLDRLARRIRSEVRLRILTLVPLCYIRTFDHMIDRMTRYANWGAAQMFIDGKTTNLFGILGHPIAKFVRDFLLNLGFLDGPHGLISVGMHVYYPF